MKHFKDDQFKILVTILNTLDCFTLKTAFTYYLKYLANTLIHFGIWHIL